MRYTTDLKLNGVYTWTDKDGYTIRGVLNKFTDTELHLQVPGLGLHKIKKADFLKENPKLES